MNRGDFFLLCVQTVVLKEPLPTTFAVRVLSQAARVPEEALGNEDVAQAALQYVQWVKMSNAVANPAKNPPAWLAAWQEGQRNRCIVRVNDNPDAMRWWLTAEDEFRRMLDNLPEQGGELPFPQECGALLLGRVREVETGREGAERFKRWVERIPGHEEQPFAYEYPGE